MKIALHKPANVTYTQRVQLGKTILHVVLARHFHYLCHPLRPGSTASSH